MNLKGLLITFEGIDGSGKSTLIQHVSAELSKLGLNPLMTFQPGQTVLGAELRRILKDSKNVIPSLTELLIFQADRAHHHLTFIKPWLEAGRIILCDRYTDSTLAYQGYGRGMDLDFIRLLNGVTTENTVPDLTILLDISPKIAQERLTWKKINDAGNSGTLEEVDRFDDEKFEFHQRLQKGFLDIAAEEPERFLVLNGLAGIGTSKAYAVSGILKKIREQKDA